MYLPLLLLQPWKALSRPQRRFVWRQCVHPLMTRWPMGLAKYCLIFFAILAVTLPDSFHGWTLFAAIFLAIFVPTDLFDMVLVARYRRKIVEYIQGHKHEIESVA